MQNIVWKFILILLILGSCGAALYLKDIRLGKDLRGGVSMIYTLNIPEDATDRDAIVQQTINVLQDRINPQGVLDITMNPLGNDRIEIVMPLPDARVKALRDAYQQLLDEVVTEAKIDPAELDELVRQNRAADMVSYPDSIRGSLILDLQDRYNELQTARADLRQARDADDISQEELNPLQQAVADAEIAYEEAREDVLQMSLDENRLQRTLSLSTEPTRVLDDAGRPVRDEQGAPQLGPSPREKALQELKSEFGHIADQLDELVAAFDTYQANRSSLDDPADLKRLLRGAGVLQFHIAVRASRPQGIDVQKLRQDLEEQGPEFASSSAAAWFEINSLDQWIDSPTDRLLIEEDSALYFEQTRDLVAATSDGRYYLLLYTAPNKAITHEEGSQWAVVRAYRDRDDLGRPAVTFELDSAGGRLMSRLTGKHVREPMAIVLDNQVYTAPTLQSTIGSRGIITGNFSSPQIDYLIRVLAAGALEARLSNEPIAENVLGPEIGQDNLNRGMEAFIIAIIAVAIFMIAYYFFAGVVANIALIANGIIIFGVMFLIDGTFTLPGLAGIVLTIGMAVDANVLIYERIREELMDAGLDLRSAIREGYAKALSTILDANITNLIICFVLFQTATTEVKGFALTLSIGICATVFTALFVTRQIYYLYTDLFKFESLPMLPTKVPAIHHALSPSIKWIKLRPAFWSVSAVAIVASLFLIAGRNIDMLDTELRGGVSATMETAVVDEETGQRLQLVHRDVQERIKNLATLDPAELSDDLDPVLADAVLKEFEGASVLTVGDASVNEDGQVTASRFQIKVAAPPDIENETQITPVVVAALEEEFGEQLDITPALEFEGAAAEDPSGYVFQIGEQGDIGAAVGDPSLNLVVPEFAGGGALMISDVNPPTTVEDVRERLANTRSQPDFSDITGRDVRVFGIRPVDPNDLFAGFTDFIIAVHDDALNWMRIADPDVWYDRFERREWQLAVVALTEQSSLDQISSFSSAVAATLQANATVAVVLSLLGILIYIWVRFGSLRYSMAAIAALAHDVIIALGVLALTAHISGTVFGTIFLIEEFRIDLGVVAALLTIIGYSLNDTIVVFDRIRENRGRRPAATPDIVNTSINQTISRTLLTSVTTMVAVLIMYLEGGSGIRPFTFTLLVGLLVGTYSSVAIASPLVTRSREKVEMEEARAREEEQPGVAAGVR